RARVARRCRYRCALLVRCHGPDPGGHPSALLARFRAGGQRATDHVSRGRSQRRAIDDIDAVSSSVRGIGNRRRSFVQRSELHGVGAARPGRREHIRDRRRRGQRAGRDSVAVIDDPKGEKLKRQERHALSFAALSVVVALAATGVFFRAFLTSHGNLIAGDTGDNRFIIAILEHWRAVARGQASFTSPNFFWPERGVLGYSESLFLMAVPYGLFRALGLDIYLAFESCLIVLRLIGFYSMLWL